MQHKNIWAPWRIEYLKSLDDDKQDGADNGCFLCRYWGRPEKDRENLVLWRTPRCLVLFNRFPYTGGHLLIAPAEHVGTMRDLTAGTMAEMMDLACDAQEALTAAIKPHGFNVGFNINRCAGAGLPDHIHLHVVPRWDGDTNFMAVLGHARVISQALESLYDDLTEKSEEMNLPRINQQ